MSKKYKCPYCDFKDEKEKLIDHVDKMHQDLIPKDYSGARVVFNMINKKDHGSCVVCGKPTEWNESTYKYNRLCNNPKCREALRKKYEKNMIKVYNTTTLLDNPDQQEKMLANRSISGKYKFKDGGVHVYTGSYEKKALAFMDKVMNIPSSDILAPGPKFEYEYDGKKHFWITDIYYIPLNLVIEVKDGGSNPNNREMVSYRDKQICKEKMITSAGEFNYLRLTNNNFSQLLYILADLKMKNLNDDSSKSIKINEYAAAVGSAIPSPYKPDAYVINKSQTDTFGLDGVSYTDYKFKFSNNNGKEEEDNLAEVLDRDNVSNRINKINIYSIKDEAVMNKEMLSNDQLEYDNMVEIVNFNKIRSKSNIANMTLLQEFEVLRNKVLPYLPVMNPKDIVRKNTILRGNKDVDILEDENGYFLYNTKTGARDISYRNINEISLDDSDIENEELERWSSNSNRAILKNQYNNEKELEKDWENYNLMYKKLKRESDWKSLEVSGMTNQDKYELMKNYFAKRDIKDKDTKKQYDGMDTEYTGIKEDSQEATSSDELPTEEPKTHADYSSIKYTQDDINLAKQWAKSAIRTIILPVNTLEELEAEWVKFKSMIRKHQRESDWKSLEIFKINNETHYEYLKQKLSKVNDLPDTHKDDTSVDHNIIGSDNHIDSSEITSDADDTKVELIKSSIDSDEDPVKITEAYNALSSIDRSKLSIYEDSLIQKTLVSSLPDMLGNVVPDDYNDLPYFSPFELDDIGVFVGENNRFSPSPDNDKLEYKDPKAWFESYSNFFSTNGLSEDEEYEKLNLARIHKLEELYLDYKDIQASGDTKTINDRKQSILELGWNPEIDFDYKTRLKVNRRVNSIMSESINSIYYADLSRNVESIMPLDEATVKVIDLVYKPVYIVFLRCNNLFGKLVKGFKKGTVTHAAIGFNSSLKTLYSFNGNAGGLSLENIYRYKDVENLKVFVILVPLEKYTILRKNVNYYVKNRSKTFYNYLGVVKLGIQDKGITTAKMTMFCSQFVDRMLKMANINITKRPSNQITPYRLYVNMRKKKQKFIYKLYDGKIEKYNEKKVVAFLNQYIEKIQSQKESFQALFNDYDDIISEAKNFPVQFDNNGNLLIAKNLNVNFEKEYSDSHKLLLVYDETKNYEAMKYELAKLWYLNSVIERKAFNRNGKDKALYKVRARILNDFNKYLKIVSSNTKDFNFTKYYESTPFNDATIKIHGSTIKYTAKYLKGLLKL